MVGGATVVSLFDTPAEELAELPVDEIGLRILGYIVESQTAGVQPNRWNILNEGIRRELPGPALGALSEGLAWLEAKVLVAPNTTHDNRDWLMVTRRGVQAFVEGAAHIRAAERLDVDLHPLLERKVRRQFLVGEYELAAFAAMKEVEVRVRDLAGAPDSLLGVKLVRQAFGPGGGVLTDPDLDPGEQVATMELFAGAIGLFKNPPSHRQVDYDDPTEAAEVVLLADLLMRLLDRVERRRGERTSSGAQSSQGA